jgi:hypothetical protein
LHAQLQKESADRFFKSTASSGIEDSMAPDGKSIESWSKLVEVGQSWSKLVNASQKQSNTHQEAEHDYVIQ